MKIYLMLPSRYWYILITFCTLLTGCKAMTLFSENRGIIEGRVLLQQFNQQGVVGQTKATPVSRWVYLFETSQLKDILNASGNFCEDIHSKKMDSVVSSKNGAYRFHAPVGKYSILVKEGNGYYIPYFSGNSGVAHVLINGQKPLSLDIIIRSEATY